MRVCQFRHFGTHYPAQRAGLAVLLVLQRVRPVSNLVQDLIMAEATAVNLFRIFGIYEELPLFVKDMSG